MRLLLTAGAVLILLSSLVACAPNTRFRRTALAPMPTGESLTVPMRSKVELSGDVSTNFGAVNENSFPEEGDSGLQLAHTRFGARARFRLGRYVSLGAAGFLVHSDLADRNATGVPPLGSKFGGGFGPQVSFHFGDARAFTFSLSLSTQLAVLPWATWERVSDIPDAGLGNYEFSEDGTDIMLLARLSPGVAYAFNDYVGIYGGVSVQNTVTNIGFDNEPREGSTMSADSFGAVPYIGVSFREGSGFMGRVSYFLPIGFSDTLHGETQWGGLRFDIGVEFGEVEPAAPVPQYTPPPYAPPPPAYPPPAPGPQPLYSPSA
ncbi:MAG: hypothetical protein AAGF12_12540 [Myxococcota bacterium]